MALSIGPSGIRFSQKKQDVQRMTAPSAGRDQKKQTFASVAISNSHPLHGTLHHATKFQAVM